MSKNYHGLSAKELEQVYERLFQLSTTNWKGDRALCRASETVRSALLGPIFAAKEQEKADAKAK